MKEIQDGELDFQQEDKNGSEQFKFEFINYPAIESLLNMNFENYSGNLSELENDIKEALVLSQKMKAIAEKMSLNLINSKYH